MSRAELIALREEIEALEKRVRALKMELVDRGLFTPREVQVLMLVREGLQNKEIGTRLGLAPRTVIFHLQNLFAKTGVRSRRLL